MHIAGPSLKENGTFQKTEDLLRDGMDPNLVMSNQIINGTLTKQDEQAEALRLSAAQDLGKGLKVDTEA